MPEYLPGGEPFLFPGNGTGCLLVHGFTGTPYEMRGLGTFLSTQFGYTVAGPALAGHATRVQDCARTTWRDWYATVDAAYRGLAARCDHIVAVGLSLGGALVLHLASHERLAGVVAVSAPAYVKHPLESWFRTLPILFRFFPYVAKDSTKDDTQDPTVRENHVAYDQTPTLAARSLILHLLPLVRSELPSIHSPALVIQGRADQTIPSDSLPIIYNALGSPDKQMLWLDRSGHLALEDYDKQRAFDAIAAFIAEHIPAPVPASSHA